MASAAFCSLRGSMPTTEASCTVCAAAFQASAPSDSDGRPVRNRSIPATRITAQLNQRTFHHVLLRGMPQGRTGHKTRRYNHPE
ncbi:hypothetical protein BOTBODRAFT_300305 [Botryobasidium botryosum FD-172 SS1]|uniref:Uncharacterized protein n=1 Tax=Botryobasidium botryosum (strain FD-172 SS1) TaxID=930990 RepID=A0A067MTW3_BOTB1|nr:hypothetical protein BOTBODRAFT_300305 [Botryobasidium botryosum FD-172 SS1]